uniref:Uncharacterized protein n=1 Tax=Lotus japonicus TaxID=34305 RepID=I3T8A5_LOTJA|nr:unknown [Lotus japonicus]
MPSLAKLMPSTGSGSSGGTSSTGKFTSHCSLGNPYKHKFSFSGSHWL